MLFRSICGLYMCDMGKPSFIPPDDIRHLRDLVRYHFKPTCMITGEKNRAQNWLTVSNLKLDDVFRDVFGKSSRSITEYMHAHPGESFDVTPFVDGRCKHLLKKSRLPLTKPFLRNRQSNSDSALTTSINQKSILKKKNGKSFASLINMKLPLTQDKRMSE